MKRQSRNRGKIAAGRKALMLWKQFLDYNRKPSDGRITGIEFVPDAIEGVYWSCIFCGNAEVEGHKDDCPLMAAIELVDEVFG